MPGHRLQQCECLRRAIVVEGLGKRYRLYGGRWDRLRELVLDEVARLQPEPSVTEHVREANTWTTSLVDRITTAWEGGTSAGADPLAVARLDHRLLDGEPAARCMSALHDCLEHPELLLA